MTTVNKLRAAKAELRIREREYNAAARNLNRVLVTVATLEKKRELKLSRNSTPSRHTKGE